MGEIRFVKTKAAHKAESAAATALKDLGKLTKRIMWLLKNMRDGKPEDLLQYLTKLPGLMVLIPPQRNNMCIPRMIMRHSWSATSNLKCCEWSGKDTGYGR